MHLLTPPVPLLTAPLKLEKCLCERCSCKYASKKPKPHTTRSVLVPFVQLLEMLVGVG